MFLVDLWIFNDKNRKEHYDVLKKDCLTPLKNSLVSTLYNSFDFSVERSYTLQTKTTSYYNSIYVFKDKKTLENSIGFNDKFLLIRSSDPYWYKDLPRHFPWLSDELQESENFIKTNTRKVEQNISDLLDVLTNDKDFKKFIKNSTIRNSNITASQLIQDYLTFSFLSIFTKDKDSTLNYVSRVQSYGNADSLYRISLKYKNSKEVKNIREIEKKAHEVLDKPINDIEILIRKSHLPGKCDYIKHPLFA